MARIYLDEDIGSRQLIALLTNAGHSATYCRSLGYITATDDFHLHVAMQRGEVMVSFDDDYRILHGILSRFAADHGIRDFHAGILLFKQGRQEVVDIARYVDAFFAAELPVANRLYEYREQGSWVQYHPRPYP